MARLTEVKERQQGEHPVEDEDGIPLVRPSEYVIPEDEQMRLIKDTGILDHMPHEDGDEGLSPLANSILDTAIFAIPLSCLYIVLDLLIQQQYAQQPTLREEVARIAPNIPTNKHKSRPLVQLLLFLAAILAGPRLIWLVNKGSWLVVIRQAPPIGTIWIYTIVQLNLIPAVASLAVVYGCAKIMNWKLVF